MLFFLVSFLASIIGAICGIGGGVIIKPVLDLLHMGSSAVIAFLSSCTVLSMTLYNVLRSLLGKNSEIDVHSGTVLAIGAAVGGLAGNRIFALLHQWAANDRMVTMIQSALLLLLTLGTLLYTLYKKRIQPHQVTSRTGSAIIGLSLGLLSSFLGIGGGPFNLVVLHYFFGMDSKRAAQNSLYIILFSQITNILLTICTGNIPQVPGLTLLLMICGGILGGQVGRMVNRKVDNRAVDKLFSGLLVVIMLICVKNIIG